jgi:hypothetical protein
MKLCLGMQTRNSIQCISCQFQLPTSNSSRDLAGKAIKHSAETISGNSKLQSSSEGEQFSISLDNLHQIHALDVEVINSNPVVPDMVSTKFSLVTSSMV